MISIVIPSYNQQEYLPESIESALAQNVPVIVVDDGSTDSSLEIARQYPVKVVSQVNKGLASARNTGIMNTDTDYILFLDADDILIDGAVEKIIEAIEANSYPDVLAPSFKAFGVQNGEVILMENPTIEDFKSGNRLGYCAAIKRSVLLECGGYSPRMIHGYEDYHLWFDLLSRGKKIKNLPDILWLYRTKEQSMIHEAQKHHDELMNQIKKDFKIYEA